MTKHDHLLNPPKGFRDFLPSDVYKKNYLTSKIIITLERFGFEPLETPAVEYASVLEGKYGEEEKLIFKFTDRAGRELALRYDQTVPLARVIAKYKNQFAFPFKRYQIQPAWRSEKPQAGRYREFLQCDFDIIGSSSPLADAEIIAITNNVLESLGFKKYLIVFNDRRVLFRMMSHAGISREHELAVIRTLDKLEKIGEEAVISQLQKIGIAQTKIENLMLLLGRRPILPKKQKPDISLAEIDAVTSQLSNFCVPNKHLLFQPTLARGLDYYTGIIIEPIIEGYEGGAVGGGGRYDNLIGIFSDQKIPAVGLSFGLDRLLEALEQNNLLPQAVTPSQLLITIFNQEFINISTQLASECRNAKIASELYLNPSDKLDKQIKYADKKGIPFAIIIGPDELEQQTVTLKNLRSNVQETIPRAQLFARMTKPT